MNIATNNQPRLLLYWDELTEAEQAEFEGYQGHDFFRYKGQAYSLDDFMRTELEGWHGVFGTSAFTAILVRVLPDHDSVVVGYAYS